MKDALSRLEDLEALVAQLELMAEEKERAAKLARATIEEQVEFVKKAVELGCHKYIGEPTYVGKFPERQDIPVEPKATHPDKKVEPGALSGSFSKVFEAVYRSDAPDDVVYEVVGKLLRAGITGPTPEVVDAMFRTVFEKEGRPMTKLIVPFTDDPMGHPPGRGGTPEQIEDARKSILEAEDGHILAEMRQANLPQKAHKELTAYNKSLCSYCGHPKNSSTCQRSHP